VLWKPKEENDFIVKRAGGLVFEEICEQFYPLRTPRAARRHLRSLGWRDWGDVEDNQLKDLHQDLGDDWEEISDSLPGEPRMPYEIETRIGFLTQNGNAPREVRQDRGQERQNEQRPPHRFTELDDEYIVASRARGLSASQMISRRFPDIHVSSLIRHSNNIGATWTQEDDRLLRYKVEEGMRRGKVDWDSIAEAYEKPRNTSGIVKLRWEFLQSHRRKWTWGGGRT
jgi:hypothetical protein